MSLAAITMANAGSTTPGWAETLIRLLDFRDIQAGDLSVAFLSFVAGAVITALTGWGLLFGRRQFRIANTIKYLEEFRLTETKERIDSVRRDDHENGKYWRVFGLMTDVVRLSHGGTSIAVPLDSARVEFAKRAKWISNYFDYAGILIKKGHIEADLFFEQLGGVVIDNWRILQPYIYYHRLAHFDRFSRKHLAYFEAALEALKTDWEAPSDTVRYLESAVACLRSAHAKRDEVMSLDTQIWFEGLVQKASAWQARRLRRENKYVDAESVKSAVVNVGSSARVGVESKTHDPDAGLI